jgi:hypothetical protein
MKTVFLTPVCFAMRLHAQVDPLDGLWQGYDGEWLHVSRQLTALAQAMPADKFAWRPAPDVRSTSEVFMHIAIANFGLLSVTGPKGNGANGYQQSGGHELAQPFPRSGEDTRSGDSGRSPEEGHDR